MNRVYELTGSVTINDPLNDRQYIVTFGGDTFYTALTRPITKRLPISDFRLPPGGTVIALPYNKPAGLFVTMKNGKFIHTDLVAAADNILRANFGDWGTGPEVV